MRYLNGTRNLGLRLSSNRDSAVEGYADASYGVHPDSRSHTRSMHTLGKGAYYARSAKQKLTTKSSAEAELVAASDEVSEIIDTREFLISQGYKEKPAILHQDNQSAIELANT